MTRFHHQVPRQTGILASMAQKLENPLKSTISAKFTQKAPHSTHETGLPRGSHLQCPRGCFALYFCVTRGEKTFKSHTPHLTNVTAALYYGFVSCRHRVLSKLLLNTSLDRKTARQHALRIPKLIKKKVWSLLTFTRTFIPQLEADNFFVTRK